MKRSLRIILPLLVLVLAVVLTTGIAFGASVPTKHMATSASTKPAFSGDLYSNGADDTYQLYAFTAPATGKLWFDATASGNATSTTVAVGRKVNGVFQKLSSTYLDTTEAATGVGPIDVVKGNTYYIGVNRIYNSYNNTPKTKVQVRTYVYAYSNNRLLKQSSSWLLSSSYAKDYEQAVIKYKIVPAKTGVMTVNIKEYGYDSGSADITLLSKTKKLRSPKVWYYQSTGNKATFGVKKGVTYYLKVENAYGTSDNLYKYGIKYSIKATTDRSLSKKSRALKLGRKKAAKAALFIAKGASENDWYKIYVSKKRETKIKVNAENIARGTGSEMTITAYRGSKKIASANISPGYTNTFTLTYGSTYGKASKGTYYFKIHRSAKASGKYTIKYVS